VNATDSALPKIDYGIITIKEEELSAVNSRFAPVELIHGRDRSYFRGAVRTRTGKSRTIATVRCPNQGQGEAQSVASDLIADLEPRWILVVGIAGAVPAEEFGLGDVLLASRLLDFSVQAAIEDHPAELDASGSRVHPVVERLLSFLPDAADVLGPWDTPDNLGMLRPALTIPKELEDDRYYGDHLWRLHVQNALRTRFRGNRGTHKPRLRIGGAASSNTLVKDTQLVSQWKSAARSITHMEMELGGVYRAAWKPTRSVPVLSVRGISDIVGFRRDAKWTSYACATAAAFVGALVTSDLPFFDDSSTRPLPAIVDLSKTAAGDLPEDTRAVEITLEVDVGDSLPHLEGQILGSIGPLAKMSEMMILRRPRVPVTITIAVTEHQIRRLLAAASSGELVAAGIKSIVPTDAGD
jgi:nucleoside phosphorylase